LIATWDEFCLNIFDIQRKAIDTKKAMAKPTSGEKRADIIRLHGSGQEQGRHSGMPIRVRPPAMPATLDLITP